MNSQDLLEFEGFARRIAEEAGKVTLEYFRGTFQVETKDDQTPVTIADRKTEETLRKLIEREYPGHGILGEEFGETNPGAEFRWILDPMDGTRSFVAGVPQYTVLVALEHERDGIVGVIHNPPLDRMMAASKGNGCRLNGAPVRVSEASDLSRATVLCSCHRLWVKYAPEKARAVLEACGFAPGWGDGFGYQLVAEGKGDVMIDPELSLWDSAPLKVCIEEAGGCFTDWNGNATIHVKNAVAANPALHRKMLKILGDSQ
jgi:histidinol phosphatase-like enzyme (inositol monophosphatase family)